FVVDAVFMEPAFPSSGHCHSLCAVNRDAILGALQPVRIPEPLLIRDGALIVVPGNVLSIWGLLIVVEEELTAHSGYGGGRFDTHRPAGDVNPVNAIVAEVTTAVMPMPVHGAVVTVPVKGHLRQGAGPDVIIH